MKEENGGTKQTCYADLSYPVLQWGSLSINDQLLYLSVHEVLLLEGELEGDVLEEEHGEGIDVHFLRAGLSPHVLEDLGGHEPWGTLEPHHAPRRQDLADSQVGNLDVDIRTFKRKKIYTVKCPTRQS